MANTNKSDPTIMQRLREKVVKENPEKNLFPGQPKNTYRNTVIGLAVAAYEEKKAQAATTAVTKEKSFLADEESVDTSKIPPSELPMVYNPDAISKVVQNGGVYQDTDGTYKWSDGWDSSNFMTKVSNNDDPLSKFTSTIKKAAVAYKQRLDEYDARIKEIDEQIEAKNKRYKELTWTINAHAGEKEPDSIYNAAVSEQGYLYDEIKALNKLKKSYEKALKNGTEVNDDDFFGQFESNYEVADFSRNMSKADNALIDNKEFLKEDPYEDYDTEGNPALQRAIEREMQLRQNSLEQQRAINKETGDTYHSLIGDYVTNNAVALDDKGQVLPWISKSAAGYLPQFIDQTKARIEGGTIGLMGGLAVGQPLKGAVAGSGIAVGMQEYEVVRGSVYRTLIDAGVDEETAISAANDEALISGLIEGGSDILSWVLAGGAKALTAIGNAAVSSAAKGSTNAAVKTISKFVTNKAAKEVSKPLWKKGTELALRTAGNVLTEKTEEWLQQGVSIANEDRALQGETGKLNLVGNTYRTIKDAVTGKNPEALSQMEEAANEGGIIALLFGGGQTAVNTVVTHYANAKTISEQNAYIDAIREDNEILDALIEEGKASGKGSVSEKIATEVEKAKKNGNVTREQVKRLIASNEVYIQAEEKENAVSAAYDAGRAGVPRDKLSFVTAEQENAYNEGMIERLGNVSETANPKGTDEADTSGKESTGIIFEKALDEYPLEKKKTIQDYLGAVSQKILDAARRFKSNKNSKFERINLGEVGKREADDIKRLTGNDATGYIHAINSNALNHVEKRHGENGEHDNSMANLNDVARIEYVLNNYDTVELNYDSSGKVITSGEFRGNDNKPAPLLLYSKKIDGTYYAVAAVSENKYKKIWAVTAFTAKSKEGITQALNAELSALSSTSETSLASLPSSKDSISENEKKVKREKEAENGNGENGYASARKAVDKNHAKSYNVNGEYSSPEYETFENRKPVAATDFKADKHRREMAAKKYGLLPTEERYLTDYVGGQMCYILNNRMMNGTLVDGDMKVVTAIRNALLKMPEFAGRTYRNLKFDNEKQLNEFLSVYSEGNIVDLKVFTSASKLPNGYPLFGKGVVHLVMDNASGRDISDTFGLPRQQEVVYLPGTLIEIKKVMIANDGNPLIFAQEVSSDENIRTKKAGSDGNNRSAKSTYQDSYGQRVGSLGNGEDLSGLSGKVRSEHGRNGVLSGWGKGIKAGVALGEREHREKRNEHLRDKAEGSVGDSRSETGRYQNFHRREAWSGRDGENTIGISEEAWSGNGGHDILSQRGESTDTGGVQVFPEKHEGSARVSYSSSSKGNLSEGDALEKSSIVLEKDENKYPYNEQEVIEGYEESVDERIVDFVDRVSSLKDHSYRQIQKIEVAKNNDRLVNAVKRLVGIDISGFKNVMTGSAVEHIIKRHGKNGTADRSMAKNEDIARVGFVIENFDNIEVLKNEFDFEHKGRDGAASPLIKLSKKINGTYYVVESVPDSKAKSLFVKSAYISKDSSDTAGMLNITDSSAPQLTSAKSHDSAPPDRSRIASTISDTVVSSKDDAVDSGKSSDPLPNMVHDTPQPTSETNDGYGKTTPIGSPSHWNSSATDNSISGNEKKVKRDLDAVEAPDIADIKKSTGFGDDGAKFVAELMSTGKTLEEAQKAVKPMYIAGFTGGDSKRAKTDVQKKAFEAGVSDRKSQINSARAKPVSVRSSGFTENEYSAKLTNTQREIISTVAKDFGMSVTMVDRIVASVVNGKEYEANAQHIDGDMRISSTADKLIHMLVLHEAGHRMEQFATDEWNILADALYERAERLGRKIDLGATENLRFDEVKEQHDSAGISKDTSGYMGEVVMRELETIFSSPGEFKKWLSEINSDGKVKSAWRKFMDFISELIGKLRRRLSERGLSKDAKAQARAELSELENIRKLYAQAYKATKSEVEQRRKDGAEARKNDASWEASFAFAGKKANSADLSLLGQARDMENSGKNADEILKKTGWYEGADGEWRFEIDDSKMEVNTSGKFTRDPEKRRYIELFDKVFLGTGASEQEVSEFYELDKKLGKESFTPAKLGDLIKHPDLFKAYPELEDVNIAFVNTNEKSEGSYDPILNGIVLERRNNLAPEKLKGVLIHEIQHAIQQIEGFASGASTGYWQTEIDIGREDGSRSAYDLYKNTAGEIEAREAASRKNLSTEERRERMPFIKDENTVFVDDISGREYSLSDTAKDEVHKALSDKNYSKGIKLTDTTPSIMLGHNGVKNLPMMMKASHIRENIFTESEAKKLGLKINKNINYHGLGETLFFDVIENLDNVKEAYRGTKNAENPDRRENYFLLISQHTDGSGNVINIPVYINERDNHNDVFIDTNKIATVFGRNNISEYIRRQISDGNLVRIKKRNINPSESTSPINAGYVKDVSDNSILNSTEKNNGKIVNNGDVHKSNYSIKEDGITPSENTRELLNTIAQLKHEFEITKFAKADPKKLAELTRGILKDYSSKADFDTTLAAVDELYTYMSNGEDGYPPVWSDVYGKALTVAKDVVESAIKVDDTAYREYSELRSYLHNVPMKFDLRHDSVPSAYRDFNDFRKKNFGRLKFTKDGTSVDSVYQELASLYPGFFDAENEMTTADQLERIVEVLDELRPVEVNPFSDGINEAARYLANDLIDRFFDIPQAKPTFADKAERRLTETKIANRKALERVREQRDVKIRKLHDKYEQIIKNVEDKKSKVLEKQKEKHKESLNKMSENRKATVLRTKIFKHTSELSHRLVKGTDKKHIPQDLQGAVLVLLESINLESNIEYVYGSDAMYHAVKRGTSLGAESTKKTQAFSVLKDIYGKLEEELTIDPDLLGSDGILSEVIQFADKKVADMTITELDTVWKAIKAIEASIRNADKMFFMGRFEKISEVAEGLRADNAGKSVKKDFRFGSGFQKLAGLDMLTPETYMHYLGNTGDQIFRMMRDAQDKHISIMKEVADFTHKALKGVNVKALEKKLNTVKLGGKEVRLTTAQLMELYVLMKREQAKDHIFVGGILPDVIDNHGILKIKEAEPVRGITLKEVFDALSVLTDEQRETADKLQEYVSTVLGKYGNQASMQVYNYEKFHEKNYWTIRTNKQEILSDVEKDTAVTTVANKGMTKGTKPDANTSLRIGSIFDTFATHSSDMATYAAWLGTTEDLNRIRNFVFWEDGERTGTVKGILDTVHGSHGSEYLDKLLADISIGVKSKDNMNPFEKLTGNYKAASIGSNFRVIIQQPTAILRALDMLGGQYFTAASVKSPFKGWSKAKKYAPIAQWKDWGYFDINTGRQMKDVLFDNASFGEKIKQVEMSGASMADSFSWGILWNAVEAETKSKHKELEVGSESYYKAVAERFTEIVDHTQVVDGILQRSQIMRSTDTVTKMATSFMGEPTKQYNMMVSALYDAKTQKGKAKLHAVGNFGRTAIALAVSGIINSAAQSIIDAMRDDDKEKKYLEKWMAAFPENLKDTANIINYIPFAKDIVSILQGYDVKRMDMETISKTYRACENMYKAITGTGKYTTLEASINLFAEIARLYGVSVANVKRTVKSVASTFAIESGNYLMQYHMEKAILDINNETNRTNFIDILFNAYNNDREAYEVIYNDLLVNGISEKQIQSGMETRMKKAEGTTKASELSKRFMSPDDERKYDSKLEEIKESDVWKSASAKQRKDAEADLYDFIVSESDDMEKTRKEATEYGVDETEYVLWKIATDIANDANDGNDSLNAKEKGEAIGMIPGLDDSEIAYFYNTEGAAKAYESGMDMRSYALFKGATDGIKGDDKRGAVVDTILKMKISDDDAWDLYLTEYDNKSTDYARDNGIEGNTYMRFIAALNEADEPTESGKYGTYTQDEAKAAIMSLSGLSREEKAILWQSVNTGWKEKNNPFR